MALYWYQCKNCRTLIKKESSPNTSFCPASSYHDWKRLAEVGDITYQCKNCGASIRAKSSPSTSFCPNASYHSWIRL